MIQIQAAPFKIRKKIYLDGLRNIFRELNLKGDVVIKLGDVCESRDLNSRFRRLNAPTDVLSFPAGEKLGRRLHLGDIHVCYPVAEEQARENNWEPEQELAYLMIHGLLHLAGFDHETDNGEMMHIQDQFMRQYFLPCPSRKNKK